MPQAQLLPMSCVGPGLPMSQVLAQQHSKLRSSRPAVAKMGKSSSLPEVCKDRKTSPSCLYVGYGRGIFKNRKKERCFKAPGGSFSPPCSTIKKLRQGLVHGSFNRLNSFWFLNARPQGTVPFFPTPRWCSRAGSCPEVRAKVRPLTSELLGLLKDIDLGTDLESWSQLDVHGTHEVFLLQKQQGLAVNFLWPKLLRNLLAPCETKNQHWETDVPWALPLFPLFGPLAGTEKAS